MYFYLIVEDCHSTSVFKYRIHRFIGCVASVSEHVTALGYECYIFKTKIRNKLPVPNSFPPALSQCRLQKSASKLVMSDPPPPKNKQTKKT